MEPGRELDAEVAEKIMGWRRSEDPRLVGDWWTLDGDQHFCKLPECSTDISTAWKVVEKLAENNLVVSVAWGNGRNGAKYASVRVMLDMFKDAESIGYSECEADALTAPHAICTAALKAKAMK